MSKLTISSIKHSFFNHSIQTKESLSFKEDDFDLNQLQNEFSTLYQLFIAKEDLFKNHETVSYLYYLCTVLSIYYQCDYVRDEVHKLAAQRMNIEAFIKERFKDHEQIVIDSSSVNLAPLSSLPSISNFRKYVGLLNTKRSYWGYSRSLANHAILYMQTICTGENSCVSVEIVNLLEQSRQPLIILGIGLYFLRFLIHFLMMSKHILYAALSDDLSVKKVVSQELDKRFYTMISDLVWAIVNLLTAYNTIFQIPAFVVSPLITSILVFDALLFVAQWSTESVKHTKYLDELKKQELGAVGLELKLVKRQIAIVTDKWEVECAYYKINILAATIIVIGFGCSMLCSGPLVLAGLAVLSSLGNALYNTTDEFKKYQQARIAIKREVAKENRQDDKQHQLIMCTLEEEHARASSDFWTSLALTTGGTAFIIALAVLSWPAALCLTLTYFAYQLNDNQKECNDKAESPSHEISRLNANPPVATVFSLG